MVLTINMLGELKILRDGEPLTLPTSKRTRALLAYLAFTSRPHRRDRLCEVFWEIPDDIKGALRWSLSKIRPYVNDKECERLVADRERVNLLSVGIEIDVHTITEKVKQANLSAKELETILAQLQSQFLEGIDLPNQALFQQWLTGERQQLKNLRAKVLQRLSCHADVEFSKRLQYARDWQTIDPFNPYAATQLITQLELSGKFNEVKKLSYEFEKRFNRAGINWSKESSLNANPDEIPKAINQTEVRELLARQKVQFCKAKDGVSIAYASVGKGLPIIKAANWLSHLEHDWNSPIWSPLFRDLAQSHHFFRYDERGNGLSDWNVKDISFESFVTDLESVVEASGHQQFSLLGISQGAAVSIEYAIRHPERVKHLILFGGYAAGWRIDADENTIQEREAVITLTKIGWGQNNPSYRQIFSSTFMPSADQSELAWFNEFQRLTTSPENAVRFLSVFADIDVREQLAKLKVPTLVLHSLGDERIPTSVGRDLAAAIPNAEFVGLESDGHLLLGREPASKVFVDTIRDFIARH
ncbi:alpha/beta fold hydrolase [Pseudoalteromonas rhizosphaerae]|uniref:Alpha/beta fold hydrolase n=1 Tax=Pseudoalteromonas rhizosphaerae TaxID=2518973 RepID=A0ABW8KUF2_9GAMM